MGEIRLKTISESINEAKSSPIENAFHDYMINTLGWSVSMLGPNTIMYGLPNIGGHSQNEKGDYEPDRDKVPTGTLVSVEIDRDTGEIVRYSTMGEKDPEKGGGHKWPEHHSGDEGVPKEIKNDLAEVVKNAGEAKETESPIEVVTFIGTSVSDGAEKGIKFAVKPGAVNAKLFKEMLQLVKDDLKKVFPSKLSDYKPEEWDGESMMSLEDVIEELESKPYVCIMEDYL